MPASRVVCFGYPARGHTVPSLPVVAELIQRGCEVEYYSVEAYRALVEGSGAKFVPYPAACESLMRPLDLDDHLVRGVAVTAAMLPGLLHDVAHADLVVCDASALWGQLFARAREVPCVVSITTFAFTRAMLQLFGASPQRPPRGWGECTAALATLNADYGAGIRDHLDLMAPDAALKLVYTSALLQPGGTFLDASHVFVGPLLARRAREGSAAPVEHDARPLAYVSLGTIFNRDHDLLRRIAGVLTDGGWRVLVSLGDATAGNSGEWPAGVDVRAFVDQIGVLREAKLFVTHGGMNSVSEALAQAVPLVVIPQGVDQHVVARRAASLGAALVVEHEQASADNLHAAFSRIAQQHATFRAAADKVRRSFDDVTTLPDAVARMSSLIDRRAADA
ncbi:MAG TPA: nucleotide disphospho-sugar-binding domain-containing protein [Pseudomonadales bacterium]